LHCFGEVLAQGDPTGAIDSLKMQKPLCARWIPSTSEWWLLALVPAGSKEYRDAAQWATAYERDPLSGWRRLPDARQLSLILIMNA
jgi:hypothetical protein